MIRFPLFTLWLSTNMVFNIKLKNCSQNNILNIQITMFFFICHQILPIFQGGGGALGIDHISMFKIEEL